jgi:hypothetical protein
MLGHLSPSYLFLACTLHSLTLGPLSLLPADAEPGHLLAAAALSDAVGPRHLHDAAVVLDVGDLGHPPQCCQPQPPSSMPLRPPTSLMCRPPRRRRP